MGNCIATNKVVSETYDEQSKPPLPMTTKKASDAEKDEEEQKVRVKRKKVTFKLSGDQRMVDVRGEEGSGNGAVRIRVVVTKEELRQILRNRKDMKCNSLEQLVSRLRLRERRVHEGCLSDNVGGSWKPALESIPEEH